MARTNHPAFSGSCDLCGHPLGRHFGDKACSLCECVRPEQLDSTAKVIASIEQYLSEFPDWEKRLPSGLVGRIKVLVHLSKQA